MELIAQINQGLRLNDTTRILIGLKKAVKACPNKLELEFFTGINIDQLIFKLSTTITVGEFLLLLKFFKIKITCNPEGKLFERPLLEKEFYDMKNLSDFDMPFEAMDWIDLEPEASLAAPSYQFHNTIMSKYDELRETIIGQDEELRQVMFFIHTNINIMKHNEQSVLPIPKRNMLITGGTGTGKTFMIQRIAKTLEIPLVEFDVSHLTQSGYVGMDITDVVEALHENSPYAPQILFLDEFDKLCVLDGDKSNVGTYGGQRSLLKILEATKTRADGYTKSKREIDDFDMSNVIIILGGAFSAFKEKQEVLNKSSIGFSVGEKNTPKTTAVSEKELIAAGIIPEIAGRLGQVVKLQELSNTALKTILTTSKESVLKTFKMLAYYDNKEFNLTEGEIDDIIKESKDLGLGVRGLSTLTEKRYIKQMLQ